MKKIIYILPGAFLLRFKKNESLLKFPSIISMLNINLLFNPLNLPGMGSGVLEDIMSIPDSSLRKRLGYEVLSFSLQAHSLSQECIDKLDIFFADDLFKYESVCIAAMEHLSPYTKRTVASIRINGVPVRRRLRYPEWLYRFASATGWSACQLSSSH